MQLNKQTTLNSLFDKKNASVFLAASLSLPCTAPLSFLAPRAMSDAGSEQELDLSNVRPGEKKSGRGLSTRRPKAASGRCLS